MQEKFTYRPSPTALLNPCTDVVFKKMFTDKSKQGRKALQCFLEAVIGEKISHIVLKPNELPIEDTRDKVARFELNCKIDNTEYVNIEMQGINTECAFEKRAEYHCAHLLNHHVPRGTEWKDVPKVYQISVLNFIREPGSEKELFYYKFRSEEGHCLQERQNIIFIELPKVKKLVKQIDNNSLQVNDLTMSQRWCIFLLYASKEEYLWLIRELAKTEEGIMCIVEVLDKISQDEIMWKREFDELVLENDRISLLRKVERAETALANAEKATEKSANEKTIEIAKEAIKNNIPIETVSKITGLSLDELKPLL